MPKLTKKCSDCHTGRDSSGDSSDYKTKARWTAAILTASALMGSIHSTNLGGMFLHWELPMGRRITASLDATTGPLPPDAHVQVNKNKTTALQTSRNATVMGMAYNYNVQHIKPFVESLRRSGFEGNIIMGISPEPQPGLEDYLKSHNVTAKRLTLVECSVQIVEKKEGSNQHQNEVAMCADPHPDLKIRWGRYALFKDFLEECEACTGPVMVSDVRDTFFQRDPFGPDAPPVKGIQIFEEHRLQRTTHWLVQWPVEQCKKIKIFDETMLCSGTTMATREGMLEYLATMVTEMREWMKHPDCCCNEASGDDQSIHNYLYYSGKLPNAVAIPNRMGIINTVGVQAAKIDESKRKRLSKRMNITEGEAANMPYTSAEEQERGFWLGEEYDQTDQEGYLLDFNGQRSFVIHQFDRFGSQIEDWLWNHGPLKGVERID